MPRSSSKSKSKSLPPLPIVAAHIGVGAGTSSSAAHPPRTSGNDDPTDSPESTAAAATRTRRRPSWCAATVTNGCIRTTVTLLVFGAYLVWTWPWHREHGFEDVPWVGGPARPRDRSSSMMGTGTGTTGTGTGTTGTGAGTGTMGMRVNAEVEVEAEVEGILRAPELGMPEEIQTKWGQYAPYRAMGRYVGPPEGCRVTQVNIEGEQYAAAVERLRSAKEFKDKRLHFLKHYKYNLGADNLTPFGAAQTFESGQLAFTRYRHLIDDHNIPFVRASGAPRVVDSAGNWSVGFAAASRQRYQPYLNVVLPESANSTLKQDCPNASNGSAQTDAWLSVFAPRLLKRFSKAAPGVELDTGMVFGLMAMCPFESVAKLNPEPEPEPGRGGSRFCALFDEEDWRDFEYHGDVEKYYKDGYGNPLGPIQGVGYVNELLARLTGTPVCDRTTHDPSRKFPLGRTLYVDFTHENAMVPVFAALGLFNVSRPLDPRVRPGYLSRLRLGGSRHPHSLVDMHGQRQWQEYEYGEGNGNGEEEEGQRWIASQMVPFSARMVTERLACERDGLVPGEYVRILVNDAVQPLEFCGAGEDGMCRLEEFVESQGYARRSGDGDFERC